MLPVVAFQVTSTFCTSGTMVDMASLFLACQQHQRRRTEPVFSCSAHQCQHMSFLLPEAGHQSHDVIHTPEIFTNCHFLVTQKFIVMKSRLPMQSSASSSRIHQESTNILSAQNWLPAAISSFDAFRVNKVERRIESMVACESSNRNSVESEC